MSELEAEADRICKLLIGKSISNVFLPRKNEIVIEFEYGSRFIINESDGNLDLSITGT